MLDSLIAKESISKKDRIEISSKIAMKTKLILLIVLLTLGLRSQISTQSKEMSIKDKMVYRRAIKTKNWSQPQEALLNGAWDFPVFELVK